MALQTETYTPEQIFASDYPVESYSGISAAVIPKFSLVKLNATSKKWEVTVAGATGIMAADAILDGACIVWVSGTFNLEILLWNVSLTTDTLKQETLTGHSIFAKRLQ